MLMDIYTSPAGVPIALSTAAFGTSIFGNAIDLRDSGIDVGAGQDLYLAIGITTAVTSAGAATLQFDFVTATDSALTAGVVQLFATAAIAKASLVAGYLFGIFVLPRGNTYKRYCGVRQIVGVADLTAGKAYAALTLDPQNWRAYDDGAN